MINALQGERTGSDESAAPVRLPAGLLMVHRVRTVEMLPTTIRPNGINFAARAMDRNRMLTGGTSATLQNMRPLVPQAYTYEPGVSLASWLNVRLQGGQAFVPRSSTTSGHATNIDDYSSWQTRDASNGEAAENYYDFHSAIVADNYLNNIRETAIDRATRNTNNNDDDNNDANNNNNRNGEAEASRTRSLTADTQDLLISIMDTLNKCLPFVIVLLLKSVYDNKVHIIEFLVPLIIFTIANRDLKREIAKKQNGSCRNLLGLLACIRSSFLLIDCLFEKPISKMYPVPKTMSELMWSIIITDMELKLFTIAIKVFVACLPARILPYKKRGKYYSVVEACSQLYRSTVTIYPWFFYVWNSYGTSATSLAPLFAVFYTNNKYNDVVARGNLMKGSLEIFWKNVSVGVSPSDDELIAAGSVCVICHEEFSNPALLKCKHIFCEACLLTWLDRERTCPLCRAPILEDRVIYRDGHTSEFIQWY